MYNLMKKIDRHILTQILSVFCFFLSILILIFWINKAINLFNKLISEGHSSSVLFNFALLSLPSTTAIVFPLACLGASIFVTYRLKNDSEFTILQNIGLSPWRIARPFVFFGVISTIILGIITNLAVPYASEQIHKNQIELDNSVSAKLLKDGQFIHPLEGITFYVKEIETDGTLLDVLLHDRRNKDEILSYTANQAFLARDALNTTLYMKNGLIQAINDEMQTLSTTRFESVAIDLSTAIKKQNSSMVYLSHVPTWLMLQDIDKVGTITNVTKSWVNLELHNRLHRPLFCLVGAILGFACLVVGDFTRFGLSKQISLALSTIILIKVVESYASQLAVSNYSYWPAIYLPSSLGILISTVLLIIASMKFRFTLRD